MNWNLYSNMGDLIQNSYKVTSADGHTSDLIILTPTTDYSIGIIDDIKCDSIPIIMIHPAMGTPATYYLRVAQSLCVRNTWIVAIEELRGVGSSSIRASSTNDWSYWTPISKDIPAHIDQIRLLYPSNPLYVMGHSVGGILLSFYLAENQLYNKPRYDDISGFISMASGSVYYRRHPERAVWFLAWIVIIVTAVLGWFPGKLLRFGGKREAKSFIRDWAYNVRFGKWEPGGCPTPNLFKEFKNIRTPSFFISIGSDMFIPHESTRMLIEQFPDAPNKVVHLEIEHKDFVELRDVSPRQVHFKWTRSDVLLKYIEEWISKELKDKS